MSCCHNLSQIHLPKTLSVFQMMLRAEYTSPRIFYTLRTLSICYNSRRCSLFLSISLSNICSVRETDWSLDIAEMIVSTEWTCTNCEAIFNFTGIQKLQHTKGRILFSLYHWIISYILLYLQSARLSQKRKHPVTKKKLLRPFLMNGHKVATRSYLNVLIANEIIIWHPLKY